MRMLSSTVLQVQTVTTSPNKNTFTLGTDSHPSVSSRWIVDSGSLEHVSPEFANFLEYFPTVPEPVRFANSATGYTLGRGNISKHNILNIV